MSWKRNRSRAPETTPVRRRSPDRADLADRQVSASGVARETFGPAVCGVRRPSHNGVTASFRLSLSALACFLLLSSAQAAPRDEFRAANQLYDAGQFAEGGGAYEKIEPKTAPVYFNLGTRLVPAEQTGSGASELRTSSPFVARDPDILANLKFAEQRLGVDEINASPKAIQRFLHSAVTSRTTEAWAGYEIAGLW